MYLDFLSAIVSQNRLNPTMQRAKNNRSVLRALPYDSGGFQKIRHLQFLTAERSRIVFLCFRDFVTSTCKNLEQTQVTISIQTNPIK